MSDFLTKEEKTKIDDVLRRLFSEHPTYGTFMNALIEEPTLTERERAIAAFVAGETTARLTLVQEINKVLGGTEE
jgi:hypothetical protein